MAKVFLDCEWYKYIKDNLEELSSDDLLEISDYYNVKYQELLEEIEADIEVENSWFILEFKHRTWVHIERQDELDTILEIMNELLLINQ